MQPRILIVDDEAPARSRLIMLLADIAATCPHQLVGEAASGAAALAAIAALAPDVLLLDVQMPGMSGLELAVQLAQRAGPAPAVIFITAFEGFALQAFEVQAYDYLLKPVRAQRLAEAIARAAGRIAGDAPSGGRRHFSVLERDRQLLVPVAEVLYMKAEQKYVTLKTSEHAYLIEESLLSLEQEFANSFVRVHRNALAARQAIVGVERAVAAAGERGQDAWQVILRGLDERLPVSRRQWAVVRALVRIAH